MKNGQTRAIVFDLDGTLLDSLEDIADTANEVLEEYGYEMYPLERYNHFVGNGLLKLIKRIMPEDADGDTIRKGVAEFEKRYRRNWNKKTAPYPFIKETLHTLTEKNILISILSNKPDFFTKECAAKFFPEFAIYPVIGQSDDLRPKPFADGALKIAESLNLLPEHCMFVGDSDIDIETGISAGMKTVGVGWGFRDKKELLAAGADIIINKPQELLNYV